MATDSEDSISSEDEDQSIKRPSNNYTSSSSSSEYEDPNDLDYNPGSKKTTLKSKKTRRTLKSKPAQKKLHENLPTPTVNPPVMNNRGYSTTITLNKTKINTLAKNSQMNDIQSSNQIQDIPRTSKEKKQPKQKPTDEWPWRLNVLNQVKNIPFTGKSGISDEIQKKLDLVHENNSNTGITEYDVFKLIVDDEFWNIIVQETNLEANLQLNNKVSKSDSKSCLCWVDCNLDEIKTFFALIILMGQIRKPSLNLYWSKRRILSTPFFNETMTISRFKLISKYIRFAKRDPTNTNPLYRLQNVIDIISKRFESYYIPKKEVSIDESIVKFKGRLKMSHYCPNKKNKRGFKIYKLCESHTSYCSKFLIVTKKDERTQKGTTSLNQDDNEENNILVGESVVESLGEKIFNQGYVIYTDNFFTSPNLCKWLLDRNTYSVGTTRMNRKNFPIELKGEGKMKNAEVKFASAYNILAVKYQDKKKMVHFLTTYTKQLDLVEVDKKFTIIDRLECAHDYNKYMHGVDLHDQKLASFTIMRRHLKWYRKLFLYLLDMCILNSSIIFHEYVQSKNSQFKTRQLTEFRFDLVEQMLKNVRNVELKTTAFKKNPLAFNNNRCYLVKLKPTERKKNPTRKCVYCTSKKRRSETVYKCEYCGVALHKACFPIYHTNKN
jgi:hypothetical protein